MRNVGGERDFNRVEIPGHEPTVVEKALSAFEGSCTEAMKRVAASRRFEGEDANLTLNFMALLAVRSPENRENVREFQERVHKGLLATITRDAETWQATTAGMKADGVPVNTAISYEDARSLIPLTDTPAQFLVRLMSSSANSTTTRVREANLVGTHLPPRIPKLRPMKTWANRAKSASAKPDKT